MSLRVLLIDDSAPMRRLIERFLETAGAGHPLEAADGNEALALFKPGGFDLVLLDLRLPGKDGLEVLREIRRQDSDVTVIIISSEADENVIKESLREGANDYLLKPFRADAQRRLLELCAAKC